MGPLRPPGGQDSGGKALRGEADLHATPGAIVRRRDAVMAPEGLGELRRLPVSHSMRDFAHGDAPAGEELGGPFHSHRCQVLPERGPADLGECALELTSRGRDTPRDVVERHVAGVLPLQDGDGIRVQARAQLHSG